MSVIPSWLLLVSAIIVTMTLGMTLLNLAYFRRSDPKAKVAGEGDTALRIDVCVPARNEAPNIEACVRSVLANDYPNLRVLIYDDQSTDETPSIVARLAQEDSRVSAVGVRALADGWVGKQWACWQLGQASLRDARPNDRMLFIDADVRLEPDCLRRALGESDRLKAPMISTFPRQLTGSLGEVMIVPLIHFILLSYLPFPRMRRTNDPASSAACGQFIMIRADVYRAVGGHSACRDSMHEGVKLPRIVRRAGYHTDLFDGTDVCSCRMYRGWVGTWRGFAKNAYEGLGSIGLLVFCTVLHLVGHVLPAVWLAWFLIAGREVETAAISPMGASAAALAVVSGLVQRSVLADRFRQNWLGVLLHPISLVLLTVLQWHSLVLAKLGRRTWRGRTLSHSQPGVRNEPAAAGVIGEGGKDSAASA